MRLDLIDGVRIIIIALLAYIPTVTLSGWFTAWTAKKCDDDLPERFGFLTFDPFAHVSIFGFALLLIGATGVIPIGNPQLTISNPLIIVLIIVIGIMLILIAPLIVWQEIKSNNQTKEDFSNGFQIKKNKSTHLETSDLNLNGKWKVYYGSDIKKIGEHAAGSVDILQKSTNLFMTLHLLSTRDGHSTERIFENIGIIENRQIVTRFRATYPKNSFMTGAMVLHPSHDGKIIRGGATFIDDDGKLIIDKVILIRD